MKRLLAALCVSGLTVTLAVAEDAPPSVPAAVLAPGAAQSPALVGMLREAEAWAAYKAKFVTEAGRVVDTANGLISHSEGQGYGLLLAVAAGDRASFERIWGWTRANLAVRDDALFAWRWEPDHRPAVADLNDSADGDILVAWALAEAAEAWSEDAYRVASRRIAVEVGRKLVLWKAPDGPVLLPAVAGFAAEDRSDGPVVSLSYYIFPAFARLGLAAPEFDWERLSRSGLRLIEASRFGEHDLPVDWISLAGGKPHAADGFAPNFAYNSIRIPLYLAWGGIGKRRHLVETGSAESRHPRRKVRQLRRPARRNGLRRHSRAHILRGVRDALAGRFEIPACGGQLLYIPPRSSCSRNRLIAVRMRYPSCLHE
jgi:endoglucanase